MSQQYEYPPPPPPPTSSNNVPTITPLPRRQRITPAQPPSITTNLARATLGTPSHTPISATSFGSGTTFSLTPTTPNVFSQRGSATLAPPSSGISPRTMVMEPYDPRQWGSRGQVSGTQRVFQQRANGVSIGARESSGMEGKLLAVLLQSQGQACH